MPTALKIAAIAALVVASDAFSPAIPVVKRAGSWSGVSLSSAEGIQGRYQRSASLGLSMLVDVPKQVLVTGASGRTGFAVFKVGGPCHHFFDPLAGEGPFEVRVCG